MLSHPLIAEANDGGGEAMAKAQHPTIGARQQVNTRSEDALRACLTPSIHGSHRQRSWRNRGESQSRLSTAQPVTSRLAYTSAWYTPTRNVRSKRFTPLPGARTWG